MSSGRIRLDAGNGATALRRIPGLVATAFLGLALAAGMFTPARADDEAISNSELEQIPQARDPWSVLNQAPGVVVDRVNVGGDGERQRFVDRVSFSLDTDIVYRTRPRTEFGVTNLNQNLSPLARLDTNAWGPAIEGGLYVGPIPIGNIPFGLFGGFKVRYAHLRGSSSQTVGSFTTGQLPTHLDNSGNGGFTFNNDGSFNSDFRSDEFKISTMLGHVVPLGNGIFIKPYVGKFYRHERFRIDTTILANNASVRQDVNERVRLNQGGVHIGAKVKYPLGNAVFATFGGHVGLAYTNARYTGSETGFSTASASASLKNWRPVGGVEGGISFFAFCRDRATTRVLSTLKKNCVKIGGTVGWDAYPDAKIVRPTTLGGGQVRLENSFSNSFSLNLSIKAPLIRY